MEILASTVVTEIAWWTLILIGTFIVGFICFIIGASIDQEVLGITGVIVFIISMGLLTFLPNEQPTDKMKYTIEITDSTKYKELVDAGYEFKKVYETKEIYEIKGDALE